MSSAGGSEKPVDDVELLVAASTDKAAFEAFYRRQFGRVAGFAAKRCSCAEDVADVVAETFMRLLESVGRYDPDRGEPTAFLLGIAGNVVNDLHRKRARHRTLVSRIGGRDLLDSDDVERVEAALDAVRTLPAVEAAVAAVPPGEQAMLRMVADGRTPGQAADALGLTPGAAWTRLSRARQRLRTSVDTSERGANQ